MDFQRRCVVSVPGKTTLTLHVPALAVLDRFHFVPEHFARKPCHLILLDHQLDIDRVFGAGVRIVGLLFVTGRRDSFREVG